MPNQIDLNELGDSRKFSLNLESDTPEDAAARRIEKAEEAKHRRRVHFWIVMLAIFLVLVFVFLCVYTLLTGSPDDKKWATAILATIASSVCSGLLGAEFGKKSS